MNTAMQHVQQALVATNIDVLIVGPGADMTALIGWKTKPMERLICTIVPKQGEPIVIVPQMEAVSCKQALTGDFNVVTWGENVGSWDTATNFLQSLGAFSTVAFGLHLWAQDVLRFQEICTKLQDDVVTYVSAETVMDSVRVVKDQAGLDGLARAAQAIDRVHNRMAEALKVGLTEQQVAAHIEQMMKEEGHEYADFVIVAAGENGASPHHHPGDRVIAHGDAVVVDIGGPVNNWFSDCTRNYVMGEPPAGYDKAFKVLKEAQHTGVTAVAPGVLCGDVDIITTNVINEAGYGDYVLHRTGHGIGLEVHENPYIFGPNKTELQPGMVFSVEPGIYKEGEWGMRIEDIVACTKDGYERLNTISTDYVVLPS